MAQNKSITSRLLTYNVLDVRDDFDERFEYCYKLVKKLTSDLGEREANDALQSYTYKGQQQHDEVQLGLYFSILIDPKSAAKCYRDMTLVAKDGLTKTLATTNQILYEKWTKLQDTPRSQLLWLIKEMVRNSVNATDGVIYTLLRQIAGGDVSAKNVWLAEAVLDILIENRAWLEKFTPLLTMVLYSYLRIIVDHHNPQYAILRQKEVDFCIGLLREKWLDCIQIGRDLVRLLQDVARIPEFEALWKEILHNPSALEPSFKGLQQLMSMRTSKKYFGVRLTPDMENKLGFLTTKVKFGQHKRYQEWFQKQYLSTPESQSLRCDLIRYICAVIHPSNEILCSEIIPRWAVIGWLLTTCTTNVVASNAKLALFYDWMFFDPEKDSIMNIEPCILVMYHSMRPHPAITATLLDFMCRITPNFYPPLATRIKEGMYTSLRAIIDKRVLQSLSPLFDNPKLDRELRYMVREHFPDFCSHDIKDDPNIKSDLAGHSFSMAEAEEQENNMHDSTGNSMADIAEFSDDDDETPAAATLPPPPTLPQAASSPIAPPTGPIVAKTLPENKFLPIVEDKFIPVDMTEYLNRLDGDIRSCVQDLQNETDKEAQCEVMDRLMQTIATEEEFDEDIASPLATCLCQILHKHFTQQLFPTVPDDEALEDSIGTALFVIFRHICQMQDDDPNREALLLLCEEMYTKQRRLGYNFLYFLKVSKNQTEGKMAPYKDLCKNMEKDLDESLMADLQICSEDDVRLLTFLIPDIYSQFNAQAMGKAELLHLIVSCIDSSQLQELICEILRGHLTMFRKDSFLKVLNTSLNWETIEQIFLWQLIAAHNIPVEHIMPILPKLDFAAHSEALTSIMVALKQDCPTSELLRPLLCRACNKSDLFTVSVLKYWAQEYEDKLADLLHAQLTKPATGANTPNRKRHRNSTSSKKDKDQPTVDQVLLHLEHMRQTCQNISFLTHEQMQQALQQVQTTFVDSQKHKYSDLLALAEDFEDMRPTRYGTRTLRNVASRRASAAASSTTTTLTTASSSSSSSHGGKGAATTTSSSSSASTTAARAKHKAADDTESESSSSEDEDIKPKHKRHKKAVVDDDD